MARRAARLTRGPSVRCWREENHPVSMQPRIAFSTLAFPDASLATAVSLGR
jgi:hypothetical protein